MARNALVLGGGGARGAYQIGAWQALSEMDFKPDIVTGTSVGALNGALYVQNSLPDAINLWENLETHMILEPEVSKNLKKGSVFSNLNAFTQEIIKNGGVDSTPLLNLLKTHIDEEKIRASKVDLGIMTVTFPNLKPILIFKDEIPKGKLCDYLMASAALFPAMKSYEIDGNAYIDGGYKDNMPVQMAIDRGADKIIAICLDPPNLYRIPKIDADVTYIKSRTNLGNLLFFDKDTTKRNMRLGYLDTLKAIGKLQGFLYSFDNDEVFIKNILPIFERLINVSNNDRLSRFIIFRHMRNTIGQKLTPELCILHCADEAASIYGLDNLKTYKLADLSKEIYEKYKKSGPGAFESIDLFAKITNNSKTLVHHTLSRFLNFSRHDIVAFFVSEINSTLKNQIPGRGFFTAAAIFPSEFQAAIYITALINQDAV